LHWLKLRAAAAERTIVETDFKFISF